ncbi:DNA-binding protein H-NS [Bradyrhizobium sp. LB8.2]|uniref:H-NS family nucleoid-associated regulatory protein n=1 Tax=unclassified Bradyrhizobium TaxID=2631580 RepID=UPI00339A0314
MGFKVLTSLKVHAMPKKTASQILTQFKSLPIDEQSSLLNTLGRLHNSARKARLKALKSEMAKIGEEDRRTFFKPMVKKTRTKPEPRYRSKKDKSLSWSGRGSVPRWMREEMKVLKLKPAAFLIGRKA